MISKLTFKIAGKDSQSLAIGSREAVSAKVFVDSIQLLTDRINDVVDEVNGEIGKLKNEVALLSAKLNLLSTPLTMEDIYENMKMDSRNNCIEINKGIKQNG